MMVSKIEYQPIVLSGLKIKMNQSDIWRGQDAQSIRAQQAPCAVRTPSLMSYAGTLSSNQLTITL